MREYKCNKGFEPMRKNIENTAYGILPAPMPAQEAINILCNYLLGDDWYCATSMGVEQVNAVMVEQILDKYSKQWKKDWKNYEKEIKNN